MLWSMVLPPPHASDLSTPIMSGRYWDSPSIGEESNTILNKGAKGAGQQQCLVWLCLFVPFPIKCWDGCCRCRRPALQVLAPCRKERSHCEKWWRNLQFYEFRRLSTQYDRFISWANRCQAKAMDDGRLFEVKKKNSVPNLVQSVQYQCF